MTAPGDVGSVLLLYALVVGVYYLIAACRHLADPEEPAVPKVLIRPRDHVNLPAGGSYAVLFVRGNTVHALYRRGRCRVPVEMDADAWLHLAARQEPDAPDLPPAHDLGGEG